MYNILHERLEYNLTMRCFLELIHVFLEIVTKMDSWISLEKFKVIKAINSLTFSNFRKPHSSKTFKVEIPKENKPSWQKQKMGDV